MRRSATLLALTLAAAAAGCAPNDSASAPEELVLPVYAVSHDSRNFVSPLSGDEEVPPVATQARGNAVFHLSKDGQSLEYKLIVTGLENVTQSHIHIAPKGANGPVVVFLFGFVAGGVTENGVLAQGTITQANLIPRPAIGFGATMPELLAAMRSGGAYVNVHTVAVPAGAIRGQIKEGGPTK